METWLWDLSSPVGLPLNQWTENFQEDHVLLLAKWVDCQVFPYIFIIFSNPNKNATEKWARKTRKVAFHHFPTSPRKKKKNTPKIPGLWKQKTPLPRKFARPMQKITPQAPRGCGCEGMGSLKMFLRLLGVIFYMSRNDVADWKTNKTRDQKVCEMFRW